LKVLKDLLTLPGNGVFTVHTGKEKKEKLLKAYFGTPNVEKARPRWEKELEKLSPNRPWLLGIPSDNGGGIQRGANWGPLVLREKLLSEKENFSDLGDVRVIPHLLHDKYLNPETINLCRKALYGKLKKLPVSPLSIADTALTAIYKKHPDARIFGIGGDHSTSFPLVKAWLQSRKNPKKSGIVHFDAHTDLLDRRLGIDFCFATWTYQILPFLKSPDQLIQIGIRSSGKNKSHWKKTLGVEQIWAKEAMKSGAEKVARSISKNLKKQGIEEIYISFDIDALDQKYASATGTPEPGGLTPPFCAVLIKLLSTEFKITGADLMELAPFVLPEGVHARDQQASIDVAADISRILLEVLE
jgi:agmatinase